MHKLLNKYLFLFDVGGLLYVLIELIWRGHSHWTMFILGGLCGSAIGSLAGVVASARLTAYRIEQLEKKVDKHNTVIERTYKLEETQAVMEEQIKVANHRIADLENQKEDMQVKDYVKPELLVVAVVLYFIGAWLKQSETVKDKYIPLINGAVGIVICAIYVFATCVCTGSQDIALAVFTAITQGILVAGLSTYVNQIVKQTGKDE